MSDVVRHNAFRAVTLACPATLGLQALRLLTVDVVRPKIIERELVVFATRDGHVASDGEGEHSPFTQALLYRIDEPSVDIELLFRKVRDTVVVTTKNAQEPFT